MLFKGVPTLGTPDFRDPAHARDRLVEAVNHKTGYAMIYDLGHRAIAPRDHRRAAGQRFDHNQAKRLGPVNRKQQRRSAAQKLVLALSADFADEFDKRTALIQQGSDRALKVSPIFVV